MKNNNINVLIICAAFLLFSISLIAQNISSVEYFIDTDPGFGNGTSVAAPGGSDVQVNFTVPLTGIGNGVHTLYVRAKDSNNNWSLLQSRTFIKGVANGGASTLPNITQVEYFIDEDPDFGNGTQVLGGTTGNNISIEFAADISNISNGVHTLYVRAKDSNNSWSLLQSRTFIKGITNGNGQSLPNIAEVEYFIDIDPGIGMGESVSYNPLTGPDNVMADFTADLDNLSNGVHTLYVRAKDSNNNWSLLQSRTFIKMPGISGSDELPNITKVEYFIDADPGLDNGIYIPAFTPSIDINESFIVDLTGEALGDHTLYVRAQDDNGNWSIAASRDFEIINGHTISGHVLDVNSNPIEGVLIEFVGLGTVLSFPDGSYSFAVPIDWMGTVTAMLDGFTFNNPVLDFSSDAINNDVMENIQATAGEANSGGDCLSVGALCVTADFVSDADNDGTFDLSGNPRIKNGDNGSFIIYFTGAIRVDEASNLIYIPSNTQLQVKNIGPNNLTYSLFEGVTILTAETGSNELSKFDLNSVFNAVTGIAGINYSFGNLKVNNESVEMEAEIVFPEFFQQDLLDAFNDDDFKQVETSLKLVYGIDDGLEFGGGLSMPNKLKVLKQIELCGLEISYDPSEDLIAGSTSIKFTIPSVKFDIEYEQRNGYPDKIGGSLEFDDPNPTDVFIPGTYIPGTGMKITKYLIELDNIGVLFDENYDNDKSIKFKGGMDIAAAVPPPVGDKVAYKFTDASITYEHGKSLEMSTGMEVFEESVADAEVKFLGLTEAEIKADFTFVGLINAAMHFSIAEKDFNGGGAISLQTPSDEFIDNNVESRILKYLLKLLPDDKKFAQGSLVLGSDFLKNYDNRLGYIATYAKISYPIAGIDEIFICGKVQDNFSVDYLTGNDHSEIPPGIFTNLTDRSRNPLDNDTVYYDVAYNTPKLIIDVDNNNSMPDFEVLLPNNEIVNFSNVDDYYYIFFWDSPDENYSAIIFNNPDAGRYGVIKNNVDDNDEALKAWGLNTKPCIDITSVTENGNGTLTIDWFDSDPDSNAKIAFRLDRDREGHNGMPLAENIDENSDVNSITVDFTNEFTGDYYLYAQITDEYGATGYDYYDIPLNIVNGNAPNTPTNLTYSLTNSILNLNWDKNGNDDAIYYNVYFANEPGALSHNSDRFSYSQESGLRVVDLVPGRYYEFAVTAYDSLYRESGFSNVQSLTYVSSQINNVPYFDEQNIITTGYVQQNYSYSLQVSDEDNDNLSFNFIDAPTGMNINNGGQITWLPTVNDLGFNKVFVLTNDNNGGQDSISFYIQVLEQAYTGNLNFSKNYYTIADNAAMLTINDFDAPGNSNEIENLSVRIYSNSDNTGITFNAIETAINSKQYNICFGLNNFANTANSLLVEIGDTIFAAYQDALPSELVKTIAHYTESPQCTQSINLNAGWNLISFDVSPSDASMVNTFGSLQSDNLIYVTGFDNGAKIYDPLLPPFLNTLTQVEDGFGYWVKVESADVLDVSGTCVIGNFRNEYNEGWNLVAYPANNPETVSDYYEVMIALEDLLYISSFNNGVFTFDPILPPFLNTLQVMQNGFGYWTKVESNSTTKRHTKVTNVFNFINGTTNLPAGEKIKVLSPNAETLASLEVLENGYIMTTPVYGDDPTTAVMEGIAIGEKLQFSWNNQIASVSTEFKGDLEIEKVNLEFNLSEDLANVLQLKVYPVPAQNIVYFEFTLQNKAELLLQIFDSKGSLIHSIDNAEQRAGKQALNYNVKDLANGIYTYKLIIGERDQVGKFEVIR